MINSINNLYFGFALKLINSIVREINDNKKPYEKINIMAHINMKKK